MVRAICDQGAGGWHGGEGTAAAALTTLPWKKNGTERRAAKSAGDHGQGSADAAAMVEAAWMACR
jgi:hypothetical protein